MEASDKNVGSRRVIALETILVPVGHEAVIKSSVTNRTGIMDKDSFVGCPYSGKVFSVIAETLVDATNEIVYTRLYNPGPVDIRILIWCYLRKLVDQLLTYIS